MLPGEAVGDDHVGRARHHVAALDVADELERLQPVARRARAARRAPRAPARCRGAASSPLESSPTRGRATPSTTRASAAPMNANCTRCSRRASALAPTSSSVTGWSGTGSGQRQRRAVDAARALDVERPRRQRRAGAAGAHERLRAALGDRAWRPARSRPRGVARAACTGSLGLRDRDRRVDHLHARGRLAELGGRPEQQHARAVRRAASAAPAATSAGPEVGAVAVDRDDRRCGSSAARRAARGGRGLWRHCPLGSWSWS